MAIKIDKKYKIFTEELLYHYRYFNIHIENLEKMLDDINRGISIHGINYDNIKTSPTFKIYNLLMNEAVNSADAKREIEMALYLEKRLKTSLDRILNNLPIHIREIIEFRYFEKKDWECIVDEVYCNKKTAIKHRDIAIKNIAVGLFGSKIYRNDNPTLLDMIDL